MVPPYGHTAELGQKQTPAKIRKKGKPEALEIFLPYLGFSY